LLTNLLTLGVGKFLKSHGGHDLSNVSTVAYLLIGIGGDVIDDSCDMNICYEIDKTSLK